MDIRDKLISFVAEYFKSGCKEQMCVGLELEHFVVDSKTQNAIPFKGANGVESLLFELSPHFKNKIYEDEHLLGLQNDDAILTLEPGSQLEISVKQSENIIDIKNTYEKYLSLIENMLKNRGQALVTLGYQPSSCVKEIELLPKKRYYFMDKHFEKAGSTGINMMRGTASCQVSIDYRNEEDFVQKYRCAAIISPILAMLSSNSPIFEKKANTNPLIRTYIWNNVDPLRTGIIKSTFDTDFSFRKYAEYILEQKAIFEIHNNIPKSSEKTAAEVLLAQNNFDFATLETYLSLVFPDIRLRKYIEIRIADSMKKDKTIAYAALVKGLFYSVDKLYNYLNVFQWNINNIHQAQNSLMKNGFDAVVYGKPVKNFINDILSIALSQLENNEQYYVINEFPII